MSMNRRKFVAGATASSVIGILMASGLLTPRNALAARPETTFESEDFGDVMSQLGGDATQSGEIHIKAPDIAENGAVVPVSIKTSIPNAEAISIVVEKNPSPLAASFGVRPNSSAAVSTRIKMGETSHVYAVVKADGKLYTASKEVKVTIGGCGG